MNRIDDRLAPAHLHLIGRTRAFAVLASIAVLGLSACSPVAPSPSSSVSDSQGPTMSPSSVSTPTPLPSAPCPTNPGDGAPVDVQVGFQGLINTVAANFWVYSIVGTDLQQHVSNPGTDPGASDGGMVVGGSAIQFAFTTGAGKAVNVPSPAVAYLAPGADAATQMTLRDRYSGPEMSIPDGDGPAEIDINATWSDGCFAYSGQARISVNVVPSATVAACASIGEVGAYAAALAPARYRLGSVSAPFEVLSSTPRYSAGGNSTDVVWWADWDPAAPVATGGHDATIPLSLIGGSMALTIGTVEYHARPAHAADLADSPTVFMAEGIPASGGTISFPLPPQAGRYVALIGVGWDLPCATGSGQVVASIDVH